MNDQPMTLLTDPTAHSSISVSGEGSGFQMAALLGRLPRMRWCLRCGGEQVFVEVFECEHGRFGVCLGCGEEKLIPFSREVAA
jgi:hypothetical protein